jgi:hypothetical protein
MSITSEYFKWYLPLWQIRSEACRLPNVGFLQAKLQHDECGIDSLKLSGRNIPPGWSWKQACRARFCRNENRASARLVKMNSQIKSTDQTLDQSQIRGFSSGVI